MEPRESKPSIEISRNSKGETQIAVKVYGEPGEEDQAKETAVRIYRELTDLYYPSVAIKPAGSSAA